MVPLSVEGDLAASYIHTSRFGVNPKPHQLGKWRLIVDLSHKKGHRIKDGVDPDVCSLTYASIDATAAMMLVVGCGAVPAKLDIASTYQIVPVHPDDWPLLGMSWNGSLYVDTGLPFGLRSAPKLFTAVVDGLERILRDDRGCRSIHYLDDYLFVGTPGTGDCWESLQKSESMCEKLALAKWEGPAFMGRWNGISMMSSLGRATPEIVLTSDALGTWGCWGIPVFFGVISVQVASILPTRTHRKKGTYSDTPLCCACAHRSLR